MRSHPRLLLLVLLLALTGAADAAVIGRVLIAVGDVSATRAGQPVNLGTGAAIEDGDIIRVGQASNAQIRFDDEAVVALRPQTVFRIDEYNFAGRQDGAEKAVFNLIQGGMRTVTGLIGKLNRSNYLVRTPTSTVGIRGTNYNLVHCDGGCVNQDGSRAATGTYGGVFDGRIGVENQSGEKTFGSDEFFYVASLSASPQALIAPPAFLQDKLEGASRRGSQKSTETAETTSQSSGISADGRVQTVPTEIPQPVFVVTEQKNTSGGTSIISNVTGFLAIYSNGTNGVFFGDCGDCSFNNFSMGFSAGALRGATNKFSFANNQLISYTGANFGGSLGGGTVVDGGTATVAGAQYGWGRWVGNFSVTDPNGSFTGATAKSGVFFGFTNDPNVNSSSNNTPSSGIVNFVLVGGPRPADTAGNIGSMTSLAGTMNFTTRTLTNLSMGLDITIPGQGAASMSMGINGGSVALPSGRNELQNASLVGTCTGAGCIINSPNQTQGSFDAHFAVNGKVMVVNGALTNAVKDTTSGARSVLFLNLLKCSTC